jgi:hypothetical protein
LRELSIKSFRCIDSIQTKSPPEAADMSTAISQEAAVELYGVMPPGLEAE